jgi:hypothetical protein
MSNIYITGDSFCFWRENPAYHWPLILANKLNLTLTGQGYPAKSWWYARQNLYEYKKSIDFNRTELFIFCHTEPLRILSTKITSCFPEDIPDEFHANEVYYKHIYDEDFHKWAMTKYFHELNDMLANRKVIHLFCFKESLKLGFNICNGYKNVVDLKSLMNKDINTEQSYNHFLPESNVQLADFLFDLYVTQIKNNIPQTKNFNIALD